MSDNIDIVTSSLFRTVLQEIDLVILVLTDLTSSDEIDDILNKSNPKIHILISSDSQLMIRTFDSEKGPKTIWSNNNDKNLTHTLRCNRKVSYCYTTTNK